MNRNRVRHFLPVVWLVFACHLTAGPLDSAANITTDPPGNQAQQCPVPDYLARVFAKESKWPIRSLDNRGQSKTPPMGFSFWNGFGDNPGPNDELVRQIADALVDTGLRDAGYLYLLAFDGGWWSAAVNPPRDSDGHPRIDSARWPNGIQAISDYIHAKGLKVGGYSDIGALGYCDPAEIGMLGHEQEDADQFARWGWDYIKLDDHGPGNYSTIAGALVNNSAHRPIVLSLSTPDSFPYEFAPRIANLWRVGDDITARLGYGDWKNILRQFDTAGEFWWAQAPGRWNDLDMLVIGTFGVNEEESKSHFSMWAIRGAPLLIGADLRPPHMNSKSSGPIPKVTLKDLEILKNAEVIAVDQDPLGASGRVITRDQDRMTEVDAKQLGSFGSGEYAVLLLNRGDNPRDVTVTWQSLGLLQDSVTVRDLWKHSDLGSFAIQFTAHSVPAHGVQMLRVKGSVNWSIPRHYEAESSFNRLTGLAYVRCLRPSAGKVPNNIWPRRVVLPWATVVDNIGGRPENKLQFNQLWTGGSGVYNLAIRYATTGSRRARISVNGEPAFWVTFPASGSETAFTTVQKQIRLQSGENTLTIDNPASLAPRVDNITISEANLGRMSVSSGTAQK
jgi:Alpha galactosidase A/Alpha galactosidase C-terminal beta sandwich domain